MIWTLVFRYSKDPRLLISYQHTQTSPYKEGAEILQSLFRYFAYVRPVWKCSHHIPSDAIVWFIGRGVNTPVVHPVLMSTLQLAACAVDQGTAVASRASLTLWKKTALDNRTGIQV